MNLLFRIIYAAHCKSTHHKLALDSLRLLKDPAAARWIDLFLKYHRQYLQGAKAPDNDFKDFRNHVLHVRENYWGGAVTAARTWYDRTVELLREKNWSEAVYAAGVLSHYYTDPIQPFHTGQSEKESHIHRAVEWSIAKSYDDLRWQMEEHFQSPEFEAPLGEDWLEAMVRQGAEFSNPHYETLIEHYDFSIGVKDPPAALDPVCRELIARLLAYASLGMAHILDRAFADSETSPPHVPLKIAAVLATLEVPLHWVTRKFSDVRDRAQVQAIYQELEETGRVEENLPADERAVRDLHAREVLGGAPAGNRSQSSKKPLDKERDVTTGGARDDSSTIQPTDDVERAPSIGPKTAKRLKKIGVRTVADLLAADCQRVAHRLDVGYITAQLIADWQAQAQLVCHIPHLRGHDAQILVACGYRNAESVALESPEKLLEKVAPFTATSAGQRILRSSSPPDLEEVSNWVKWSQKAA